MKFKLRDYLFWALVIYIISVGLSAISLNGQEKEQVIPPVEEQPPQIKTWKLPEYMQENLQWMLNDFNKKFDEKVQVYKKELKTRFEEFKDMPEDVVLNLEGGIFIERSDYLKLQEQLRRKMLEEQIKKEVKENDKTIN